MSVHGSLGEDCARLSMNVCLPLGTHLWENLTGDYFRFRNVGSFRCIFCGKSSNSTQRTFWSCQNPVAIFIMRKNGGFGFQIFGAKVFFGVRVDSLKWHFGHRAAIENPSP